MEHCALLAALHIAKVIQSATNLGMCVYEGLKRIYRMSQQLVMKVLLKRGSIKSKRPRRKPRQWSKYIYCRTKNGPRIISRQKPRIPYKFILCSVSSMELGMPEEQLSSYLAQTNDHSYDSDSYNIGIDNHASYCLTNSLNDFVDTPVHVKTRV